MTENRFLAYGGVIALKCLSLGIPVILVTAMHDCDHIILAPLIDIGFIENKGAATQPRIIDTSGYRSKPWRDAVDRCLGMCLGWRPPKLEKKLEEERQQQQIREKLECEKQLELSRRKTLLNKEICGFEITDDLREQLLPYVIEGKKVKVCSSEVAFIITNYWGNDAPRSKACHWSTARCFYGSQNELRRWLTLNRTSDRCADTFRANHLEIHQLGEVKISTASNNNEMVVIEVELVNERYGNRWESFTFDKTVG